MKIYMIIAVLVGNMLGAVVTTYIFSPDVQTIQMNHNG